jgi:hypothetical protein
LGNKKRKLNEMGSGKIYYQMFKLLDIFYFLLDTDVCLKQ